MSHSHDHDHSAHGLAHSLGHSHGHGHGHDFSKANADHFDKTATQYDEIAKSKGVESMVAAMQGAYAFDKDRTTVLDFACGTGSVSRHLVPHARKIVGVDISQGMIDVYNNHMHERGVPPEHARGVVADLKGTPDELDGQKFDVATCNMAYHHLASINDTTTMLASFLASGGKLLVVDLMPPKHETSEDPMFEEKYHAMVAHRHGFDEATMRAAFEGAVLEKFTYDKVMDVNWDGKALEVFLATGSKKV